MFPWTINKQKIERLERRIEELESTLESDWFMEIKETYCNERESRYELATNIVVNGVLTREFKLTPGPKIIYTCKKGKNKLLLTQGDYGFTGEKSYYAILNGKDCDNAEELFRLADKLYAVKDK